MPKTPDSFRRHVGQNQGGLESRLLPWPSKTWLNERDGAQCFAFSSPWSAEVGSLQEIFWWNQDVQGNFIVDPLRTVV